MVPPLSRGREISDIAGVNRGGDLSEVSESGCRFEANAASFRCKIRVSPGWLVRGLCAALVAICSLTANPAAAQPRDASQGVEITPRANRPSAERSPSSRDSGAGWWSTIGSLALVLAAILVLGVLLKSQLPGARGLLPRSVLQDLGRRPLDPRHTIHLVRCGSRILILGISPQGMTSLGEIADPIEVDSLTGLCQPAQEGEPHQQFGQLLKGLLGLAPESLPPNRVDPEASDPASHRLKTRLQSLATSSPAAEAANG